MLDAADAHLVNGRFEGNYFEYDYENCGTPNPEHISFFAMRGECRWCSVEDVKCVYTVSSGTTFGSHGLVNGAYSRIHKAPGKWEKDAFGRFVTPFVELGGMCSNKYMTVARYLGYQGITTKSSHLEISFYDAVKKPLGSEIIMQYCRARVPAGAKYYRVAAEVDESCRCASDAEDGWDGMQNMTFRRIRCRKNPNGDFTICCGHDFVYEDCSMRFNAARRVGGTLYRNCEIRGGNFDCRYRSRLHASRFENCRFTRDVRIGSRKKDDKKVDRADWEIVVSGCTFEGTDAEHPITVTAGLTGRIRDCTIRNAVLEGEKARFENCKTENVKE